MSNMQDFYCEEISGFFNFPHALTDNERVELVNDGKHHFVLNCQTH